MNISDDNVMATKPRKPVQGHAFPLRWPSGGATRRGVPGRTGPFATDEELEGEAWYPNVDDAGDATARVVDAGPDEDVEKIEFAILQAIACARTRIDIMTPYFLRTTG